MSATVGDFVKLTCEASEVLFKVNLGSVALAEFRPLSEVVLKCVEALSGLVMLARTVRLLLTEGAGSSLIALIFGANEGILEGSVVGTVYPAVVLAAVTELDETLVGTAYPPMLLPEPSTTVVTSLTTMFTMAEASFKILATIDRALKPLDIPIETILLLLSCTGLEISDPVSGINSAVVAIDFNTPN